MGNNIWFAWVGFNCFTCSLYSLVLIKQYVLRNFCFFCRNFISQILMLNSKLYTIVSFRCSAFFSAVLFLGEQNHRKFLTTHKIELKHDSFAYRRRAVFLLVISLNFCSLYPLARSISSGLSSRTFGFWTNVVCLTWTQNRTNSIKLWTIECNMYKKLIPHFILNYIASIKLFKIHMACRKIRLKQPTLQRFALLLFHNSEIGSIYGNFAFCACN